MKRCMDKMVAVNCWRDVCRCLRDNIQSFYKSENILSHASVTLIVS